MRTEWQGGKLSVFWTAVGSDSCSDPWDFALGSFPVLLLNCVRDASATAQESDVCLGNPQLVLHVLYFYLTSQADDRLSFRPTPTNAHDDFRVRLRQFRNRNKG